MWAYGLVAWIAAMSQIWNIAAGASVITFVFAVQAIVDEIRKGRE